MRRRPARFKGPFRGFAWAVSGSFRPGISRIFQAILNYSDPLRRRPLRQGGGEGRINHRSINGI